MINTVHQGVTMVVMAKAQMYESWQLDCRLSLTFVFLVGCYCNLKMDQEPDVMIKKMDSTFVGIINVKSGKELPCNGPIYTSIFGLFPHSRSYDRSFINE